MDKLYKFEFTQAEANLILESLTERPFKLVQGLVSKLINDFNAQNTQAMPVVPEELPETVKK